MRVQSDNAVLAVAVADVRRHEVQLADHNVRLRKLEFLTAKVVGGALVGSAVGGWLLPRIAALL